MGPVNNAGQLKLVELVADAKAYAKVMCGVRG